MKYYIASCVFTAKYPELSKRIQDYVASLDDISIVRCCVPGWKKDIYEEKMPQGELSERWMSIPQSHVFLPEDEIWSLCPNCMNISEEWRGVRKVHSLWELIDQDQNFPFPDCSGLTATIQDCWRMRDRNETHNAVRHLLEKMNVHYVELENNRERADYCGNSLYRPQVERNPKLAPKHYKDGAKGLFQPHSAEEQEEIMRKYCSWYTTETVICYCHYCLEGLISGGVGGHHLAELLFKVP